MDFQSSQYSIDFLIQRIRAGRLALPDFQREFVWNPARVVELLDSVARQWPIGSLLLLNGPQPFAFREIDSAPKITGKQLDAYILDGQQRITALYHAITDSSEICYYIDFSALTNGDDGHIKWEKRAIFEKIYGTKENRAKELIALISEIWEFETFYEWLEHTPAEAEKSKIVNLRERKLGGLQSKVYKVMAIELEQEIDLEALARIFETLNRTGVKLNAFDLMVAALYPSGFHLRDEWDTALRATPILQEINPDALEVLKLLALLVRFEHGPKAAKGVRQGDLLAIDRNLIKDGWSSALDLYIRTLKYCANRFGVISEDLVPSWSMILGVAGWLNKPNIDDDLITEWWINRLFGQYYSQAANTRVVADFSYISDGIYLQTPISKIEYASAFKQPARRNGLLARGIGALLVQAGARDILTGEAIPAASITLRAIDRSAGLRSINSEDTMESIVVLSAESDRKLPRAVPLMALDETAFSALKSQGIEPPAFLRNLDSIFQNYNSAWAGDHQ
ncbi:MULTISPECIES: DUF262 domain-containing protein [unclassified Variovorax]|uniref:DUF262 domain-containing protein n=1 Tax=unclassified Variovorax TaxID=663243 RepID=UPI003F452604